MSVRFSIATKDPANTTKVFVFINATSIKQMGLSKEDEATVRQNLKNEVRKTTLQKAKSGIIVAQLDKADVRSTEIDKARRAGSIICKTANQLKVQNLFVTDLTNDEELAEAFLEGIAISNYQFLKYKNTPAAHSLKTVKVLKGGISSARLKSLQIAIDGMRVARDLVNEPLSFLTAAQYSKEIRRYGKEAGFKVEVFTKRRIESLKMGGLLAVNRGSEHPPTFNVLEWKPKKPKNKRPVVFVGKGVVYDTGGVSLKPTANSMDLMKSDMAGSAAVVGAMYSIAKAQLPVHVVALIPATDNRPGKDAYVPGDVITMHSGKTVEVLNTDAEGRMILADALHYAKKYNPELVIDLATLTGAAARAIGPQGLVMMGNASEKVKDKFKESGTRTYERLVEFPMWEEYGDYLKSEVADIKNIGGAFAGAITAGKFLEHFVDYPWMHLDIAGSAFLYMGPNGYFGKGGTGVGVRLLFDYIQRW